MLLKAIATVTRAVEVMLYMSSTDICTLQMHIANIIQ